jgi:hypothetical protein
MNLLRKGNMESLTAVRAPPWNPRFHPWRQGGVRGARGMTSLARLLTNNQH